MGQRNNSRRNATLDEHKERAAGRQQNKPGVDAIRTWRGPDKVTGGAFGRGGKSNGAAGAAGKALDVGRSTRRTRKKAGR